MAPNLKSKVAIITGASSQSGIGFNIARRLLSYGATVVMTDVLQKVGLESAELLQKEFSRDRVEFLRADITVPHELEGVVKHTITNYKRLDIMVNNAGRLVLLFGYNDFTMLQRPRVRYYTKPGT